MNKEDDFERMVKDLQKKIEYEEETIYSRKVISEYRNPNNFGAIEDPEAIGKVKGSCGDTMKITLRIEDGIIRGACFWTDGCGATIACGNMLTKMIQGKTPDEAADVSNEKLIEVLDGLPKEHLHCAKLAVDSLHKAIANYHKNKGI